ncbi:MAG TPA: sugar ABC transporter permease [Phycisphaerae bacterium]|nr:sugar ABC transporter permease [Phycisphaerae bacterium]
MRARSDWRGYLFVAPATVYLLVFSFVPMVIAAYLSVHRWHLLKEDHPFVGAGNYLELLRNPFFRNAVWNTAVFAALSVPLGMIVALAVAILVNQKLRGVAVFRTLYYIPAVSSGVALSMVWIWILLPQDGLINYILRYLGYSGDYDFLNAPAPWRLLPAPAMLCLVAMSVWIGLGPRMVIFLAGLQGIPDSLYESAEIDGCNGWQRFRYITLPLLMPTTFFVLITSTIAAFQLFTQVYIMTRGGPQRATDVVVYHIYKEAWHRLQIGMASAQSYVLFGIILLIAIVQFALMRRRVEDAGEW